MGQTQGLQQEVLEDKEFDHMLMIPEKAMKELHSSGQADVVTVSGKQRMTIRLIYRAGSKEQKDSHEDSEVQILEELLSDEKKFKVPSGARGNAKKVLEWKKKYGNEVKGMTPVGWARARQLASQSEIPLSTVKRMAAFNRHRKNAEVDPKFKSTPWKDRGYVAWLGWGGSTGIDWAIKISAANDSLDPGIEEESVELSIAPSDEMIGDLDLDARDLLQKVKALKLLLSLQKESRAPRRIRRGLPQKQTRRLRLVQFWRP